MSLCVAKALECPWRSLSLGLRNWRSRHSDSTLGFGMIMVTFPPHMANRVARDLRSGHPARRSDHALVASISKHKGAPDNGTDSSHPPGWNQGRIRAADRGGPRVVVSSISAQTALAARVARVGGKLRAGLSPRGKSMSSVAMANGEAEREEREEVGKPCSGQLAAHQQLFAEIPFPPSHD